MAPEEAAILCAQELARGGVVAVHEGRSEHGPRALGNRSLLSGASLAGTRDRINSTIKFREGFRPLAPIVHQQHAREYFELEWPSPYMMYIVECKGSMRATCAEGCHIDGTARVQTVSGRAGFMSHVLEAYERETGVPVLLNTSFNLREPIVETPQDAMRMFLKVPLSLMWIEGELVGKPHSLL